MDTVQSRVDKVMLATGKVIGKVTPKGVETVIEEFISLYQEAMEADTSKKFGKTLAGSSTEVKKHLMALRMYDLADSF
jgi:hypothetical protein